MPCAVNPIAQEISVIIPAKMGDETWRGLTDDLKPWLGQVEILIVTQQKPSHIPDGVTWVAGRGRRAENMNDGAAAATRQWLWFIHGDSRFKKGAVDRFLTQLENQRRALYYFDLCFADDGPAIMAINSWGANFRSHTLGVPFGDQAFCVHRDDFEMAGRYDEILLNGEDHLFVWQCRHKKIPLIAVRESVITSARRYRDEGWLFVVIKFQYRWIRDSAPQYLRLLFSR